MRTPEYKHSAKGLILSGIIIATGIIGSGFAWDPISISAMKLLHAAELPIMIVAIFKYIAGNFDPRLSSTMYLAGFQFTTQVVASVLSILVDHMYDEIGFALYYKLLGCIVSLFVMVSCFTLRSHTVEPKPFHDQSPHMS